MRRWLLIGCLALLGCAKSLPPPVVMPEPPRDMPPAIEEVPPRQVLPPIRQVSATDGQTALTTANRYALVRPQPEWFQQATLIYPRDAGRIYHILTKDQEPTILVFPPPERVLKIPMADDGWFDIELIERETAQHPDMVVILSKAPKRKKSIAILTTEGPLALLIESHATQGLVQVQWSPMDIPVVAVKPLLPSGLYYAGLEITPVYGSPPWTPVGAWAIPAAARTLVQFPPAMKRFGMPIIKAIGADGETKETMNWRVKGEYIEIDRFFQVAEVRFGHEDQQVVRIAQTEAMTAVYCPGAAACPDVALAR